MAGRIIQMPGNLWCHPTVLTLATKVFNGRSTVFSQRCADVMLVVGALYRTVEIFQGMLFAPVLFAPVLFAPGADRQRSDRQSHKPDGIGNQANG